MAGSTGGIAWGTGADVICTWVNDFSQHVKEYCAKADVLNTRQMVRHMRNACGCGADAPYRSFRTPL